MNPYHYTDNGPQVGMRLQQPHREWLQYAVDFASAHPTRHLKNNLVQGDYYQPPGAQNAPLVILFHGIGDQLLIPCNLLARMLVKRGMACFVLYSVFHSRRMPFDLKRRYPALTPEEWFETYVISVTDIRQVIDWAEKRAEINREQVALVGISFGGFISAITMGVDDRVKTGVLLIAGGNSEKIGQFSRKRHMRRGYHHTKAEYERNQLLYRQYLTEVAARGFENVNPPSRSYLIDPMTFGYKLRERPVLMLNALWDEYIPREATLDLWEASGKPELGWFPGTHTLFWLWFPLIRRRIARFLITTFAMDRNPHTVTGGINAGI
jgi:acetyl esterase/lipase